MLAEHGRSLLSNSVFTSWIQVCVCVCVGIVFTMDSILECILHIFSSLKNNIERIF